MSRLICLAVLLLFAGCDFDGPYNTIPCKYDLAALYDTLKTYHLSGWGAAPFGFKSKSRYSMAELDSTSWDIYLSIDTPNGCFFNEHFVMMLAEKVFDEPANPYFQLIVFQLKQPVRPSGSVTLVYMIDRNTSVAGLRDSAYASEARIVGKHSGGTASAGKYGQWKTVSLELDAIPRNPYELARRYWLSHKQYSDVRLHLAYPPSGICKGLEYQFWFE